MHLNLYTLAAVLLVAGLICFFIFFFSKICRFLLKFILRMTFGVGVLSLFNTLAAAYGICIGLNIYTVGLCGLLGLPGYILLMGTRLIC